MSKRNTLRLERWTRILVGVLGGAVLVTVWSVFLSAAFIERQQSYQLEVDRLQRSARALAGGLGRVLGDGRLALEILTRQVAAHPNEDPTRAEEFLSLVRTVHEFNAGALQLVGADSEGRLHTFPDTELATKTSVADRTYFRLQESYPGVGFFIDLPVLSRLDGRWNLHLSQSVPPNAGHLAVLAVKVDFAPLDHLVAEMTDYKPLTVSVYRWDNELLYRAPRTDAFPHETATDPLDRIRRSGRVDGVLAGEPLRAYAQMREASLTVVVSRPEASMSAAWESWFLRESILISMVSLAICGLAVVLWMMLGRLSLIRRGQEDLARSDPLTGLLNRRAFLERCDLEQVRTARHPTALCLMVFDLDHFKLINDRFGHQTGDLALTEFSDTLVRVLRSTDAVARVGGEEFAVLMIGTSGPAAQETAARVLAETRRIRLPDGHLTTSVGLALWDGVETFDGWYHRADRALYRAKAGGRDRVETAEAVEP